MKYGTSFDANGAVRAPGTSHNAALRGYANVFDLSVDGGTADALVIAQLGAGCVFDSITIECDANLSGQTFKIGTADDDDKYGVAAAGPNATVQVRYPPIGLNLDPTSEKEDILLTPNGAIAGAGTLRTKINATHR